MRENSYLPTNTMLHVRHPQKYKKLGDFQSKTGSVRREVMVSTLEIAAVVGAGGNLSPLILGALLDRPRDARERLIGHARRASRQGLGQIIRRSNRSATGGLGLREEGLDVMTKEVLEGNRHQVTWSSMTVRGKMKNSPKFPSLRPTKPEVILRKASSLFSHSAIMLSRYY